MQNLYLLLHNNCDFTTFFNIDTGK